MPIRSVHNEYNLLEQVAKGNQQAFEDLFHAYSQQLAEYVLRLTESMEMTEDIVQDVFIKLWMKREELPALRNFTHYLFILSRNHTFNCLRKKANQEVRHQEWARQFEQETHDSPATGSDYTVLIEAAVTRLPPQQQKVYLLSRQQQLKHEEIAAQLGISVETSKKHIKLALRSITQYVRQHMDTMTLLFILLANNTHPFST